MNNCTFLLVLAFITIVQPQKVIKFGENPFFHIFFFLNINEKQMREICVVHRLCVRSSSLTLR